MTDNEIIKALEYCSEDDLKCNEECPFYIECSKYLMAKSTLNLINRQKAEIEQLQKRIVFWREDMDYRPREIKSDAIKEFAERLTEKFGVADCIVTIDNVDIDNLVKEMTEVEE